MAISGRILSLFRQSEEGFRRFLDRNAFPRNSTLVPYHGGPSPCGWCHNGVVVFLALDSLSHRFQSGLLSNRLYSETVYFVRSE
jgi:hypothetical protein